MKKIKIYANGKNEKHIRYTLEKKQEFFKGFRQLLRDIGYKEVHKEIDTYGRPSDKNSEPILSEEEDIATYRDQYDWLNDENMYIDIVYTEKKIFLIFNTMKDMQEKVAEGMKKFCSFA